MEGATKPTPARIFREWLIEFTLDLFLDLVLCLLGFH